jgi:hypothetical protein
VALLHNIAANRELREGDKVEILVGSDHGRVGSVIGFDLTSDRPVLVQHQRGRGTVREKFAANEVEIRSYEKAPTDLEPLPTIRRILSEMRDAGTMPKGRFANLRMSDGTVLTLIAKQNQDIRRIYEDETHQSLEERVAGLLRKVFVTRLPHLVKF